jgi:hypothetical protein
MNHNNLNNLDNLNNLNNRNNQNRTYETGRLDTYSSIMLCQKKKLLI